VPNPGDSQILLENNDTVVVVPVFTEASVIAEVITDLSKYFPNIVCIDDGSADGSGEIAEKSGAHVVWHPMNFGQGAALQTGIEAGLQNPEIKYFVTFDADGQHSPLDALEMVRILRDNEFDVVFGSRFLDERTEVTAAKRVILKLAVTYTNALTGLKLTDAHNGLRAFNRSVASSIDLQHNGMAHATEIVNQISKGNFRYCESPVHIVYTDYTKAKGQSLWNSVNILFDLILR
jgi:glycosyltransferase involved in cell wall biosynthesis